MPSNSSLLLLLVPAAAVVVVAGAAYFVPRKKSKKRSQDGGRSDVKEAIKDLNAYKDATLLLPKSFLLAPQSTEVSVVDVTSPSSGWINNILGVEGVSQISAAVNWFIEKALSPLDLLVADESNQLTATQKVAARENPKFEESSRLLEARLNPQRSFYYKNIQEEAERYKDLSKAWSDPDFTHSETSLYNNHQADVSDFQERLQTATISWQPPQQFCCGRKTMGKGPDGKHTWLWSDSTEKMQQEASGGKPTPGSQYGSTAIECAIQHFPFMADDLIDAAYEEQGIYGVSVYQDLAWRMVYVDSYFPCYASAPMRHRLLFGSGDQPAKEIWSIVFEKACAKLEGSYEAIEGQSGVPLILSRLMRVDTNCISLLQCRSGSVSETEQLFKTLKANTSQASSFVLAYTHIKETNSELPAGTSLAVTAVVEAAGVQLVQLMSTRGPVEWTGSYSVGSALWDTEPGKALAAHMLKQRISTTAQHFWMTLAEFVDRLQAVEVCRGKLSGAESRRRVDLLTAFADNRSALKPGIRRRENLIKAKLEADKMAADLIAEEEKRKKNSPKPKKKKGTNGNKSKVTKAIV